jgi:hypothetical protein
MVEAGGLDADEIRDHVSELYSSATKFLNHLAPNNAQIEEDDKHIQEIQKPDSTFTKRYRRYEAVLNINLSDFRTKDQEYVRLRAIHRRLQEDRDPAEPQPAIDLVVYLANLVIFTKQMIGSDRGTQEMWVTLRELDRAFPRYFLPAVANGSLRPLTGQSSLQKETFELALELRTHLAIRVLESASNEPDFDPEATLDEVFYRSGNGGEAATIRGWHVPGLEDEDLSGEQIAQIEDQMERIRELFADIDTLGTAFPWKSLVLQLLQWVRLRHRELQAAIQRLGGIDAIADMLRNGTQPPTESAPTTAWRKSPRKSPRKSRTSFTRERRRASGKFDAHDVSKNAIVDALIARENTVIIQAGGESFQQLGEETLVGRENSILPSGRDKHVGRQARAEAAAQPAKIATITQHVPEQTVQRPTEASRPQQLGRVPSLQQTTVHSRASVQHRLDDQDHQPILNDDDDQQHTEEAPVAGPSQSAPRPSGVEYVRRMQEKQKVDKENQNRRGWFERHPTAEREEWGDGFDGRYGVDQSQRPVASAPSRKGKEPQRSSPRKRPRAFVDSDEDEFETVEHDSRAQERRQEAPVAKRARIQPASSAPPSHQPEARNPVPQEESLSEAEAPDMTEEAPAPTYAERQALARQNERAAAARRNKRIRKPWTAREEEAFMEYMAMYPQRYSAILEHDRTEGYNLLQERTQVNLKDKARNMAVNMIK